jgi:hypothetical protein
MNMKLRDVEKIVTYNEVAPYLYCALNTMRMSKQKLLDDWDVITTVGGGEIHATL